MKIKDKTYICITPNQTYRPIALANFTFKIITKILAAKLAPLLPGLLLKTRTVLCKLGR